MFPFNLLNDKSVKCSFTLYQKIIVVLQEKWFSIPPERKSLDLCRWKEFLKGYSNKISPDWPHISRWISCDNAGETRHVTNTRMDSCELCCHFRTVCKKREYLEDCSNIQIKPLYVILSVILQAHNITIKHIKGCKSFAAAKIINLATWNVEYWDFRAIYIPNLFTLIDHLWFERKILEGHLYALIICSNKF